MYNFLISPLRNLKCLVKKLVFLKITVLLLLPILVLSLGANFVNAQDADLRQSFSRKTTMNTPIESRVNLKSGRLSDKDMTSKSDDLSSDIDILRFLQEEFAAELATLRGRVDSLEARTAELEAGGNLVRDYCFRAVLLQVTGEPNDDVFRCLEEAAQRG